MSRVMKHRSEIGTPQKPTMFSSEEVIPTIEESSTTERLRKANTTITNEVLKQLTSRINNVQDEEEDIYKKRITCNFCLMKSKLNIKGKCVQHSVPNAQNITQAKTPGLKEITRQVDICIQSSGTFKNEAICATTVKKKAPVEDVINELLEKLDEILPMVQRSEDINKPLYQQVALQFQKLLSISTSSQPTDCIPMTPITKPKKITFQDVGLETPIKLNEMSRSHVADTKSMTPRGQAPTPIAMIEQIKNWTNHFYAILQTKQIPQCWVAGSIRQDLSAYISIMEDKFYQYAVRFQDLKRHIDQLNNKLIGYIELASEQVSDKQIEDDLAFVEKASSMGSDMSRQRDQVAQKHRYHSSVNLASEELLRMLLVQANSVEGMILELEQSSQELSASVT